MSNHLAFATVTAALQRSLQSALNDDDLGASVTTVRPDASNSGTLPDPGVNLFLYQVTPNGAWSNVDLPTRDPAGQTMQRPRVALDLHYLFTFHGDEGTLAPQRVLGSVVRSMHARPVLTRSLIESTVAATGFLAGSNLAEEVELVKFTSEGLNLEELSKLWSVMFQTTYALSIAYLGTVVLVESTDTPRRVLPVRERRIDVLPFQRAVIDEVVSAEGDEAGISEGDTIVLRGQELGAGVRDVRIGDVALAPLSVTAKEVRVVLTDPTLRAGVQGVRIDYASGATSNTVALVLRPRIAAVVQDEIDADGDGADDTPVLRVTLTVTVGTRQQALLYLNGLAPVPGPTTTFSVRADAIAADGDTLVFRIVDFPAGNYLVRVEVGGADSLLGFDALTGEYDGPTVSIV